MSVAMNYTNSHSATLFLTCQVKFIACVIFFKYEKLRNIKYWCFVVVVVLLLLSYMKHLTIFSWPFPGDQLRERARV